MTDKGTTVKNCPIHLEVCYRSCFYWGWNGEQRCHFPELKRQEAKKKEGVGG